MQIHTQKLENNENSQSCKKSKWLTYKFEKSKIGLQYIQI